MKFSDLFKRERRTFSNKQQIEMLQNQGGKCAGCSRKITLKTGDGDHVYPFSAGGPTVIWNGQMLCKPCHKKKSKSERGVHYGKAPDPLDAVFGKRKKQNKKSNNDPFGNFEI